MVSVVDRLLLGSRSSWSMFAGNLFVLMLLLAPLGFEPSAPADEGTVLEVRLPGGIDRVELFPHDPRVPELAQVAPDAAKGLFVGHLEERGWRLHLVWTAEVGLGVLDHGSGASWVTVDSGVLVPFEPKARDVEPVRLSAPLVAPETAGEGTHEAAGKDGVLQIALDADAAFHERLQETWREVQLMVIHLVDGVYQANLGVPIEVVSQHTWTEEDPEPFLSSGSCFDVLPSFRDHWEAQSPTVGDEREATHLFSGGSFSGTTIGCAYIGQLDTSRAYGVSGEITGPIGGIALFLHRHVALVSHEIGHNFNGRHEYAIGTSCYGATIMFDTLCANSPVFSGVESLTLCRTGLVSSCSFVTYGNAYRMWYYASDRI